MATGLSIQSCSDRASDVGITDRRNEGEQVTVRFDPFDCEQGWTLSVGSAIWRSDHEPDSWFTREAFAERVGTIVSADAATLVYVDGDGTELTFHPDLTLGPPCS